MPPKIEAVVRAACCRGAARQCALLPGPPCFARAAARPEWRCVWPPKCGGPLGELLTSACPRPSRLPPAPLSASQNSELLTLTYGAIVAQIIRDYEDPREVNRQLEQMCVPRYRGSAGCGGWDAGATRS
jgi:hypothetical protein